MAKPLPPLILLAGPTATGKTALAVALARVLGAEIVSADSMQVYRGLAVGTAQATEEELQGLRCHLSGCVDPWRSWTAADWLAEARGRIDALRAEGRAVVVAGGTGLYFKCLDGGLFEAPGAGRDPALRERLEALWCEDGGEALRRELAEVDPETAGRLAPGDRLRQLRALEVWRTTGRALSAWQREGRERARPLERCRRFVLSGPRAWLYERIDRRVEAMLERGLVEELRALVADGARADWPAMRAIGYPQLLAWLEGRRDWESALEEMRRLSRRYAKQQLVLLRRWPGALWLDAARGLEENLERLQISLELADADVF